MWLNTKFESRKNTQNTAFGYKKRSKLESDIGSRSPTQPFCIVIFATFAWKWLEHGYLGGGEHYYQFTHKLRKNTQNTVFDYKKGSKFESDIGLRSAAQIFCIVIFTTFA